MQPTNIISMPTRFASVCILINFGCMSRQYIIQTIVNYLKNQGVKEIGIFGSFARDQEKPDSDIDVLVEYRRGTTLFDIVKIKQELSALIGKQIDLVSKAAVRPAIMKNILKDLQVVYHA